MLEVQTLSKAYGRKQILNDLSFTVHPGEVIGLVGENGAGKSTLLQILATLSQPSAGEIMLYDQSYRTDVKIIRRQIGFVPQDIALWEDFSVKENMRFFEKLSWNHKNTEQLRQLCQDMKLNKWNETVKQLSGGMKRKLNIAVSLIHDPDLLILDEPTAGIDLKSRKDIASYLAGLAKTQEKMILYTSHDLDQITQTCDRIYCMGDDPFYYQVLQAYGEQPVLL
ncbi:ABC transporter ATP-binding protein [Lentibacillus halophilus]|uniref:ABC transporter ATP-binding protein n=1 Tax=Lentibacillus halophilus TaxID=295065 RepID=A0ABP3J436_9BACI